MKSAIPVDGRTPRAGGEALSVLAAPLNVKILKTLEEGPRSLSELRQAVGSPPQSTMRVYSRMLTEQGIVTRQRQPTFPSSSEYRLTRTGEKLLRVGDTLQQWLEMAPAGPIALGTAASKRATKALVQGWSTNLIRALAARALSLTELSQLISTVSYPSIERRLSSMRLTGLVTPVPGSGRGTPYLVTEWLRRAVVPVASAVGWERRHGGRTAQPFRQLDAQAAFLLALPLVDMPEGFEGTLRLTVELEPGSSDAVAGAQVRFDDGRLVSCTPRLKGDVDALISGSPRDWFEKMGGSDDSAMTIGGDVAMAEDLLAGLQRIPTDRVPAARAA